MGRQRRSRGPRALDRPLVCRFEDCFEPARLLPSEFEVKCIGSMPLQKSNSPYAQALLSRATASNANRRRPSRSKVVLANIAKAPAAPAPAPTGPAPPAGTPAALMAGLAAVAAQKARDRTLKAVASSVAQVNAQRQGLKSELAAAVE